MNKKDKQDVNNYLTEIYNGLNHTDKNFIAIYRLIIVIRAIIDKY